MNFDPEIQLQALASRNNLHFLSTRLLDAGASKDFYMFALDRRQQMVSVWHVSFDQDNEMMLASELFQFDPDQRAAVPDCLLGDAWYWQSWEDAINADDNPYARSISEAMGAGRNSGSIANV